MTAAPRIEIEKALVELRSLIESQLGDDLLAAEMAYGELSITVPATALPKVLQWLRDDPNTMFKMLVDVCGVDYPDREQRFDVV